MKTFKNNVVLDKLSTAARTGHISRRSFMQHSIAAGMSVTAATGLWTAKAQAQPKRGGTFRLGQHEAATGDGLDPGLYQTNSEIQMAYTMRAFLTQINSDGSLGADVATEWSSTPDASEWTFKLNPKASFHSGGKVTANDVVASINFHRGEKSTSAVKALLANISDIVANDDQTVTFKMTSGNADLPWLMADYHLVILPRNEDGTANWQTGDGCGPYVLDHWKPGISASLTRHEGWHGEGAYFDAIEITYINDSNARQTALVTGDVDAVSMIENKTMALLERRPGIKVLNVPSAQAITWPMHCDTAPFDNPDVRNAIKLSVDRQEMIDKITFGAATIANDFHHSPAMPYWPDDIPQREYDPEQAKWLLKQAEMENLSVSVHTSEVIMPGAVDAAVLFADHAKGSGINITVKREASDGYYSDIVFKKPWCMVQWGARPTPDVMYSTGYKDDAPWNESRWQNEEFNKLLLKAKSELDESLRAEMYRDMAMLARDDGGTVLPFFPNFVYAVRDTIGTTGEYGPNWHMDGHRACSRWWFNT